MPGVVWSSLSGTRGRDLPRRAERPRGLVVGGDEDRRARRAGVRDLGPDDVRRGADGRRERRPAGRLDQAERCARVTVHGLGQHEAVALEPRLDDVQRHAAGAVPGPVADRLPERDERRLRRRFQPVRCSDARVAVVAAVGRAPGRRERQAEHAPAAAGVGRVEQQVAQAAVADAHLEQGVEAAQGVGLDGLAGPPAGVDGAAEARIGAADGGEERGAPEGAAPQGERVPRVVLGGRAAADVGVALGVERRAGCARTAGAYPNWVRRLMAAVDAQRVVGEARPGRRAAPRPREQRRGGGAAQAPAAA